MALLDMLGLGALLLACDIKDNIEDKIDEKKCEAENRARKLEMEAKRQEELERRRQQSERDREEYRRLESEKQRIRRIKESVPKKPIYDTDVNLRCSFCGGHREVNISKGRVICPYCDRTEFLNIIGHEEDKQAIDRAIDEYEEQKRLKKLEEQRIAEAKSKKDEIMFAFISLIFIGNTALLVDWIAYDKTMPVIVFNSIAIPCFVLTMVGIIKPVLKYTVFLPFVVVVWLFDKYLNLKEIGFAVGTVITLLVDGLIVLLLIEWIGGGI